MVHGVMGPAQPGRVLDLFGIGADAPRRVLIGTIIDGLWAALVAHKRSARTARGAFLGRIGAVARLSPHLATVLDGVGPEPVRIL